jgi:hypothetical protein
LAHWNGGPGRSVLGAFFSCCEEKCQWARKSAVRFIEGRPPTASRTKLSILRESMTFRGIKLVN